MSGAESLISPLITLINNKLKYVWSYETYIRDLDVGLTDLEKARDRRKEEVDRAIWNAEDIYQDVTSWLEDVERRVTKGKEVIKKDKNSEKGCFCGMIPNPCALFLIAEEAEKNKQKIEKLQERNAKIQRVSHRGLPAGIVTGNYKGPVYWIAQSRASLLENISRALLDPNVRIVGVWGAAGVGKSVLLKQLEKQVQESKLNYDFDEMTMAVVSRSPNWEKIQDDLGYRLGLNLKEENTMDQKAHRLRKRLRGEGKAISYRLGLNLKEENTVDQKAVHHQERSRQKAKILIILDDIWEMMDMMKLGIPFDDTDANIKVLVTSRSEQVLMEMASERIFHLNSLEACEAVDLFKYILGDPARDESTLIDQLAKECIGLPILISPLASSLKSRPPSQWVDSLRGLRQRRNQNTEKFIEDSLEFCYHLMKSEEAKLLFLLCGRIGSQIISIEDLVLYEMGLGLLKGVPTIDEAREKVDLLVKDLKASCLLEDYKEGYVKIHDLMADAALSIASKTHPSLVIRDGTMSKACSHDGFSECRSITLYHHEKMRELPERLICPKLEILLLYAKESRSTNVEVPDAFFQYLGELKVLDLSYLIMTSLPSSIQFLGKLHTLCLHRVKIEDVAIIGQLKTLRSLTFRGSNISRIPKEIGELINLRLLDLRYCSSLRVIEPNVLGNLINVEELLLPTSFDEWDAEGTSNASLTELNNMSFLCSLTICVPNAASIPNIDLPFHQLVWFVINIGNKRDWKDDFIKPRTLKLDFDSKDSELIWNERLQTTLKKTQDLYLHGWIGFEESITELSEEGFPELRHIQVEHCPLVQYIIHSKQPNAVPVLETLFLLGLTNLQKLCRSDQPHKYLNNLKVIKIKACDELKNLFSSSLVKSLPNLEEIDVSDCIMIQEIISYTEMDAIVDEQGEIANDESELLELKSLHKLELANLYNISSFCGKNKKIIEDDSSSLFQFFDGRQVSLPCLKSLTLCDLPELRVISHNQHPVKLHHLKSLKLSRCESLLYAVDSNLLKQLKNLESLTIESCKSMETIFNLEDLDACGSILNHQPLQIKLQKIEVSDCHKLKYLFPSSLVKSIENIMSETTTFVSVKHAKDETIMSEDAARDASFFNNKVMFPNLEEPETGGVKEIWPKKKPTSFFMDLKVLVVKRCHQLSVVVPPHMLPSLHRLESLSVESCNSVREIFTLNKYSSRRQKILQHLRELTIWSCGSMQHVVATTDDNYTGETYHQTVIFPQLSSLSLYELPRLGSFGHENHEIGLPALSELMIHECEAVEVLVADSNQDCKPLLLVEKVEFSRLESVEIGNMQELREIWHIGNEETHYSECSLEAFCKLERLYVYECEKLLTVFPSKIIRAFHNLKKVSISECISLESVFESPGLRSGTESLSNNSNKDDVVQTTFALSCLDLRDLPSMKQVWDVKDRRWAYLSFKKLYEINVKKCHRLTHLFPASVARCLLQLNELEIWDCQGMEGIVYWNEESAIACAHQHHQTKLLISTSPSSSDSTLMRPCELEWPSLEKLLLRNCPNAKIFSSVQHKVNIPRLKEIDADASTLENSRFMEEIYASPTLLKLTIITGNKALVEIIPWSLLVQRFPNLRSFDIWYDESEQLFSSSESDHYEKEGATISCKSGIPDIFETLKINHCDHLTVLLPSWAPFRNLTILSVYSCNGLQYLVTSFVARRLVQLTELRVSYCTKLEEIVRYDCDENGNRAKDDDDMISFPHLTKLWLDNLPELRSFSSTSYKFNFPSLIDVTLDEVSKMHVFCGGDFTTPYKHRITREIAAIRNEESHRFEIPRTR